MRFLGDGVSTKYHPKMASNHLISDVDDVISPVDSVSNVESTVSRASRSSVSSRTQRAIKRAALRVEMERAEMKRELERRQEDAERALNRQHKEMNEMLKAFDMATEIAILDAEDLAEEEEEKRSWGAGVDEVKGISDTEVGEARTETTQHQRQTEAEIHPVPLASLRSIQTADAVRRASVPHEPEAARRPLVQRMPPSHMDDNDARCTLERMHMSYEPEDARRPLMWQRYMLHEPEARYPPALLPTTQCEPEAIKSSVLQSATQHGPAMQHMKIPARQMSSTTDEDQPAARKRQSTPCKCSEEGSIRREDSVISENAGSSTQLEALFLQQAKIIGALQAPKVSIPQFTGDPLKYASFMRAFEDNVEKLLDDDAARLARLVQLCAGEAARVVEGCLLLPASQGYRRARQLLEERFGDSYVITDLWIKRLVGENKSLSLREMADELRACETALEAMNATSEMETMTNLAKIVSRLPGFLQSRWRSRVQQIRTGPPARRPRLKDIVDFVEIAAKEVDDPVFGVKSQGDATTSRSVSKKPPRTSAYHTTADETCPICSAAHEVKSCDEFKKMNPQQRVDVVYDKGLCLCCLHKGHKIRDCQTRRKCNYNGCQHHHARLLHDSPRRSRLNPKAKPFQPRESSPTPPTDDKAACNYLGGCRTLLPIIAVKVTSPETGRSMQTYALLDSGSTNSFCQEEVFESLGVSGVKGHLALASFGRRDDRRKTRTASLVVSTPDGDGKLEVPRMYAVKNFHVSTEPAGTMEDAEKWPHLRGIPFSSASPDQVRLIIGQDCPDAFFPLNAIRGEKGEPYAIQTQLGWTLNGPVEGQAKGI